MLLQRFLLAILLASHAGLSGAQPVAPPGPAPQNVVQLQATGQAEATPDILFMSLTTVREGRSPAELQRQLQAALDTALREATKTAAPKELDVRTGAFGLQPRYGSDGKIGNWQGTAELILEGRDFDRITTAAARVSTLTTADVGFRLSPERRAELEAQAQARAVDAFRTKAAELARAFGFARYTLREVTVSSGGGEFPMYQAKALARVASAAASSPVPVQAGNLTVNVGVSGTVQMQ